LKSLITKVCEKEERSVFCISKIKCCSFFGGIESGIEHKIQDSYDQIVKLEENVRLVSSQLSSHNTNIKVLFLFATFQDKTFVILYMR